ncbi:MAG: PaaI family thioesterase, partial [Bacteroidales bacterium]|nr:PaaI family thioesterase [Bacteroidales bacterium]
MSKTNVTVAYLKTLIGKPFTKSISPSTMLLGGTLRFIEAGEAWIDYPIKQEMSNPIGMIQGGFLAALIDDTIGLAFFSMEPKLMFTTTNLNVNYLFGARVGETVLAKAKVIRMGKKIANFECKIYNSKDEVIASSTTNLVVTTVKAIP